MANDVASNLQDAFCAGCGYPLRELTAHRCPECGRPFDPADPRTMSLGKPLRQWQRWLLRPMGWPTIGLALLGTAGLVYLSRRPSISPAPWRVLWEEFRWPVVVMINAWRWPRFYRIPTIPDAVFFCSVVLWAAFVLLALLWGLLRRLVPATARRTRVWQVDTRLRHRALATAAILSVGCAVFGWQQRIGRRCIANAMAVPWWKGGSPPYSSIDPCPVRLTPKQACAVLGRFAIDSSTPQERLLALKLLIEHAGRAALPALRIAAGKEQDSALLATKVRLIGLCRDPATAPLLIAHLRDPRPAISAAAADAVGILRHPTYSIDHPNDFWIADPLSLDSMPPIDLAEVVSHPVPQSTRMNFAYSDYDLIDDPPVAIDPSVQLRLLAMMTRGRTAEERQAAARAIVAWPPAGYRLRVAEWGVWISNHGHMALAKSILDEIPPFVHRTGNPLSDFGDYFLYPSMVTKPIVHLTSNMPLAGRPGH